MLIFSVFAYLIVRKVKLIFFIVILFLGIVSIKSIDAKFEEQYNFLKEEEYQIKAIVVSEPTEKQYKDVYQIEMKQINGNKVNKPTRWLLNIKKSKNTVKKELSYGDVIVFSGKVEIPSTARNYMGFDYQRYLKSKKIYGNIIVQDEVNLVDVNQGNFLGKLFYDIRVHMKNKIYELLPEGARELCIGILIGERSDIEDEITESFRNSNLTHMLAVSGAHISYIILGISVLLNKVGKKNLRFVTIAFLLFFMGITEFTPSVERASMMSILLLLSNLIHRKSDIYTNLAFSAIMILIFNPYAILNIGFQLSYGGTIGIVLLNKRISKWFYDKLHLENREDKNNCYDKNNMLKHYMKRVLQFIIDMLVVTISANIIILPIMAFQFNTISFTFWISNILAGPLLGIIIILGFILYLFSFLSMKLAVIIAFPLQYCILLLILVAKFCSKLPFSDIIIQTPYIVEVIIYYASICFFYYFQSRRWKIFLKKIIVKHQKDKNIKRFIVKRIGMISIILVMLFIHVQIFYCNGDFKIYFIDVGQGDCTLICTKENQTILIDSGGSENGSFDVGKQILLPYLLDRRITTIDYLIVSHFDSDHCKRIIYNYGKVKSKECNYW